MAAVGWKARGGGGGDGRWVNREHARKRNPWGNRPRWITTWNPSDDAGGEPKRRHEQAGGGCCCITYEIVGSGRVSQGRTWFLPPELLGGDIGVIVEGVIRD